MAFAHVGAVGQTLEDASATTIVEPRTGVTAGNLLAIWVKHEGAATSISVSDGTSAFAGATKTSHSNGDLHGQWFYLLSSVASGSVTYTVTFGASRPFRSLILFEASYTGTAVFDTEAVGQATSGTTPASAALTTTGTDEMVLGGYGEYSSAAATAFLCNGLAATASFWTLGPNYTAAWARMFTAPFTGTVQCTLDASNPWLCNGLAIKIGAAPDASLPYIRPQAYRRPLRPRLFAPGRQR